MNTIPTLITEGRFNDLLICCEQLEIQSTSDDTVDLSLVYPIYLANCILINDLETARHVRKRIRESRSTPELDAIWRVAVDLIKKAYPQVYHDLDNYQWSEWMQPLIVKIKETIREHMFQLVSKIYTSIDTSQASDFFGMPETPMLQELTSRGWKYNQTTHLLYPVKPAPAPRVAKDVNQFAKLADIVLNLEKF